MDIQVGLNRSKTLYEVIVDGIVRYTDPAYFNAMDYARGIDPTFGDDDEAYQAYLYQQEEEWMAYVTRLEEEMREHYY